MEGKYCRVCLGKSHERSCSEKASFQAKLKNGENLDMKIHSGAKQSIVVVVAMGSHWDTWSGGIL